MKTKSIIAIIIFVLLVQGIALAQEVRIDPTTTVTIETGTIMDITSGNLILESNASGDVSLIVLGAIEMNNGGKIHAERYLPGSAQTWHLLGSPVSSMTINGSAFAPGGNDDFFAWYESSPGTWVNYKNSDEPAFNTINGGDSFIAGKGYLIAYNTANSTKTFSGNIIGGNVTFTLKNSGSKLRAYESGWNLMSNPYTSSIDWNKANRSQFQDDFVYVYDPNKSGGEGYISVDGGAAHAYIGPHQGFFVIAKTTANNQIFNFTNTLQTHEGGNFLKSTDSQDILILKLSSQEFFDETTIKLSEESDFSRDRKDGIKLYSFNSSVPQLYSISQDKTKLSVNSVPHLNDDTQIPLGIQIPNDNLYTISIQSNTGHFASNILYLEDKVLNKLHKLSNENYQFTAIQGDIKDRFVLHFGATDIHENAPIKILNIYTYHKQLNIISDIQQAMLEIFDMQGRLISSKNIHINGKYSEMLKLLPGIYIVRLQNSNMVKSKQIIIN